MKTLSAETLEKFLAYHSIPGNGEWASLHITMSDGNFEDENVRFCFDEAVEKGDTIGAELGKYLLGLNENERKQVSKIVNDHIYGRNL